MMSTNTHEINWIGVVQLATHFFLVKLEPELNQRKEEVIFHLLDGELDEAVELARSLPDPIREEMLCGILLHGHAETNTSLVASSKYNLEAYRFALWFLRKRRLSTSQSLIRSYIIRDVLEGVPILAVGKIELLEDKELRDAVLRYVDVELLTFWWVSR
jgi:hypothetical protein